MNQLCQDLGLMQSNLFNITSFPQGGVGRRLPAVYTPTRESSEQSSSSHSRRQSSLANHPKFNAAENQNPTTQQGVMLTESIGAFRQINEPTSNSLGGRRTLFPFDFSSHNLLHQVCEELGVD